MLSISLSLAYTGNIPLVFHLQDPFPLGLGPGTYSCQPQPQRINSLKNYKRCLQTRVDTGHYVKVSRNKEHVLFLQKLEDKNVTQFGLCLPFYQCSHKIYKFKECIIYIWNCIYIYDKVVMNRGM